MSALDNIDDAFEFDFSTQDLTYAPNVNPNPMPEVMVDLESMGTRPDAPILAIGAVTFNLQTLTLGEMFYINVDLASSVSLGSVIDPDTVMWWLKQSDEARSALTRVRGVNAPVALQNFSAWLDRNTVEIKSRKVWGCGPDFDCVLLSEHYRKAMHEVPWMFWNQRDYRTVKNLYQNVEQDPRVGHHKAVDDAVHQVNHLFKIKRSLRGQA